MDPLGSGRHPAAPHEAAVETARRRARLAMIALGATLASRVFSAAHALWLNMLMAQVEAGREVPQATLDLGDSIGRGIVAAKIALLVVTAVLFLRWLHAVVGAARALGAAPLRWTPRDAVQAFVIPFVNLWWPYRVVRDVHDSLAPDAVPAPQPVARVDDAMGYRDVRIDEPPPPMRLPRASIGAWWGTFVLAKYLARIGSHGDMTTLASAMAKNQRVIAADVCDAVAAGLALVVVRALTARLLERFRRVRHNAPEALEAAGVTLG